MLWQNVKFLITLGCGILFLVFSLKFDFKLQNVRGHSETNRERERETTIELATQCVLRHFGSVV